MDQEKTAFFAPNGKKFCFQVLPFGLTNAPPFYTCMMSDFQADWTLLGRLATAAEAPSRDRRQRTAAATSWRPRRAHQSGAAAVGALGAEAALSRRR